MTGNPADRLSISTTEDVTAFWYARRSRGRPMPETGDTGTTSPEHRKFLARNCRQGGARSP